MKLYLKGWAKPHQVLYRMKWRQSFIKQLLNKGWANRGNKFLGHKTISHTITIKPY